VKEIEEFLEGKIAEAWINLKNPLENKRLLYQLPVPLTSSLTISYISCQDFCQRKVLELESFSYNLRSIESFYRDRFRHFKIYNHYLKYSAQFPSPPLRTLSFV
jgi:hypothetical protein